MLRLAPAHVPPLPAGEYCVTVLQRVKSRDKAGTCPEFEQRQRFHVAAPRMALSPQDVYAVYPPDGAVGDFGACLPQVVLSRRSLPWERSLQAPGGPDDQPRPWMALLLLNEGDFPGMEAGSLDELVKSVPVEEVFGEPYPWERDGACRCLDLPPALFRRLAPRREELPYLAHVRVLSTADMDAAGLADRDAHDGGDAGAAASAAGDGQAWLSVVVANRLPGPGENLLCLVSLEGREEWLGQSPGREADAEPPLRLVVLASSRFIHEPGGPSFHTLAQGLDVGPLRLAPTSSGGAPNADLAAALARGYTALRHHGRTGREMVSWYRGPLVPPVPDSPAAPRFHRSADAALRYDPELGMLDVSYAVAWELGRLLGLRDRGFIEALAALRQGYLRRAAERLLRWDRHQQRVEVMLQRYLGVPSAQEDDAPPQDLWDWDAPELLAEAAQELRDSPLDGIPVPIAAPLRRWFLLHDVPLDHLLPQPGLLPDEALRYFRLDLSWVVALFDGAMSWGRSPQAQTILERAMTGMLLRGLLDELEIPYKEAAHTQGGDAPMLNGMFTGFMLRSELVAGWPGLRLCAFDGQGRRLRPLRIERIAGDTLLCLYGGELDRIIIDEPPQGLYFRLQGENAKTADEASLRVDVAALAKRHGAAGSHELARALLARPVRIDIHSVQAGGADE